MRRRRSRGKAQVRRFKVQWLLLLLSSLPQKLRQTGRNSWRATPAAEVRALIQSTTSKEAKKTMPRGERIPSQLVDPGVTEADLQVARAHASANFARIVEGVPKDVQDLEASLESKLRTERGTPLRKLRLLYKLLEPVVAALGPFVACRPGCSSCCLYPIGIMPLEADLISKRTGMSPSIVSEDVSSTACPFLVDNRCSIYDDRPMACRKHVAITNTAYWCQNERANVHALPMITLSKAESAFEYVIALDGRRSPIDIRDAFGRGRTRAD